MNILFICSAKTWGGNEKWVSMAMQGLQDKHNVYFLGKTRALYDKFGKDLPAFWAPFRSVFDLKTKEIISQIISERNIDIIISTKKKEYFLAGLVAKSSGTKHIIRLGITRKMSLPFWHRLVYKSLNNGIIVNAVRIKEGLSQYPWMRNHPIEVIYNGIPKVNHNDERMGDDGFFTIVTTGMLTRRKGHHILIEGLSLLPTDKLKNLQVHILGIGAYESSLKKIVQERGLEDIVSFHGFSDPTCWLKRAKLFCLLSANEGISNALIEAMSHGVPSLTTCAGGAAEVIQDGENGFLVERTAAEVAGKLQCIMDMPENELREIGKRGKCRVQSMFSMETMVSEMEAFLHNFV
ncbi:glycosyltransferase [Thermophagus sp. OGC60D27]|uniref:glycosyltransferase n=1 Tax=Thermophagus sp. OGC60D27 TaxID=3458415 RepID=UPI004037A7B5